MRGGESEVAFAVPKGCAAAEVRLRSQEDARRQGSVCGPGRIRGGLMRKEFSPSSANRS